MAREIQSDFNLVYSLALRRKKMMLWLNNKSSTDRNGSYTSTNSDTTAIGSFDGNKCKRMVDSTTLSLASTKNSSKSNNNTNRTFDSDRSSKNPFHFQWIQCKLICFTTTTTSEICYFLFLCQYLQYQPGFWPQQLNFSSLLLWTSRRGFTWETN